MAEIKKPDLVIRAKVKFATTFEPSDSATKFSYMEIPIEFDSGPSRKSIEYLTQLPDEPNAERLKKRIECIDYISLSCRRELPINRGDRIEVFFVRKSETLSDGYEPTRLDVLDGISVEARYFARGHEPDASYVESKQS